MFLQRQTFASSLNSFSVTPWQIPIRVNSFGKILLKIVRAESNAPFTFDKIRLHTYTINFVNNVHNLFYLMSREDTTPYDRAPSNFDICLVKFVQI